MDVVFSGRWTSVPSMQEPLEELQHNKQYGAHHVLNQLYSGRFADGTFPTHI